MRNGRQQRLLGLSDPGVTPDQKPARPEQLRQANAREVLRLLRLHSPCSCADLVRFSGLSAPTISSTIEYLRRKDLVAGFGEGASSGGRPPRLLRFNEAHGYVAGVDIGGTTLRIALADLNGKVLGKSSVLMEADSNPQNVVNWIASGIRQLLGQYRIPRKKLLMICAGAPGITDVRNGIVISAPNLCRWKHVPLRKMLEASIEVPATIENDVNLGAIGEHASGTARGVKDFVFLAIGSGIGAGIFVNGSLYHGAHWTAGEIGYLYNPLNGEPHMDVNRPGALESLIGGRAIEDAWRKKLNQNGPRERRLRSLKATEVFDLAESGNAKASEILKHTAGILAGAISTLGLILDTSLVVLGGGVGDHPALVEATTRILAQNQFARPKLVLSRLGRDAQLCGSIWLGLRMTENRVLFRQPPI